MKNRLILVFIFFIISILSINFVYSEAPTFDALTSTRCKGICDPPITVVGGDFDGPNTTWSEWYQVSGNQGIFDYEYSTDGPAGGTDTCLQAVAPNIGTTPAWGCAVGVWQPVTLIGGETYTISGNLKISNISTEIVSYWVEVLILNAVPTNLNDLNPAANPTQGAVLAKFFNAEGDTIFDNFDGALSDIPNIPAVPNQTMGQPATPYTATGTGAVTKYILLKFGHYDGSPASSASMEVLWDNIRLDGPQLPCVTPDIYPEISDIIIGDKEGNEGQTQDMNVFEFPDAVDLSNHVVSDSDPSDFNWRFVEMDGENPTFDYTINGKISGEENITDVGGNVDTNITIVNETLSPGGSAGAVPFATPPATESYVRAITFYMSSNGCDFDSQTVEIKSVDGSFDDGYPPSSLVSVDLSDWTYSTIPYFGEPTSEMILLKKPIYNIVEANEDKFVPDNPNAMLRITAADNTQQYGSWQSPIDEIPYDEDAVLYRATWVITTSGQSDSSQQPGIRTMLNTSAFADNVEQLLLPSPTDGTGVPAGVTFSYQQYFAVSDLSSIAGSQAYLGEGEYKDLDAIYLSFEMFNFLSGTSGSITLEELVIDKYNDEPSGTTVYSYTDDFSDWSIGINTENLPYLEIPWYPTTNINLPYLPLACPIPGLDSGCYYGWRTALPSEDGTERVTMQENKIYRARFEVKSTATNFEEQQLVPSFRMRMFDEDQRQSVVRQLTGLQLVSGTGGPPPDGTPAVTYVENMPLTTGKFYDIYFQPMSGLPANADFLGLAFEMTGFNEQQIGTITCESVTIDEIEDLP